MEVLESIEVGNKVYVVPTVVGTLDGHLTFSDAKEDGNVVLAIEVEEENNG